MSTPGVSRVSVPSSVPRARKTVAISGGMTSSKREQITASGQQLAQLGEGNPALFQGTPQRQRERCLPAGGVLPAPPPAQVWTQPMPRRDTADLPVAPEARKRAPRDADNLHRPGPPPGRPQPP